MTAMSDLPLDLVEEILSRVPIISLRAVRSTCKRWNNLSKDPSLTKKYYGKEAKEAMAVMICHSKACLMNVNLHNHKDLVDSSIKQIGKLNQVKISEVYHCDGLLLCVTEKDWRLVVWNPYLGQIRWIQRPRNEFGLVVDTFAIGYDSNNNHKILKLHHPRSHEKYEIYDFKCSSWRFLGVTTDRYKCRPGVNLKGNTYLIATRSLKETTEEFLVCFGFTSETFGPRLPLPFHSVPIDDVQLSVVGEEKLAVLFHKWNIYEIGIWITTKIDHNIVSWRNFLKIEHNMPLADIYQCLYGSFFVDEKKKAAMFFYVDTKASTKYKAYVVGENGYYKEVDLRENKSWKLMCSYVPSSVQISSKVFQ
ncbi:PREDICTED: putative F-box protein At5g51000 [Camelina sativa]|uniref:F-box protein At5g51000 n=1 Tax=Camelina sativa TaxID=90675 RepID=A0ABM0WMD2_CAMSA|nr:PREDICTED: putative F-box protein At5g51000 [Camelina sativa]